MELSEELDISSTSVMSDGVGSAGNEGQTGRGRGRRSRISGNGDEEIKIVKPEGGSDLKAWSILGILVGLQMGVLALSRRNKAKRVAE